MEKYFKEISAVIGDPTRATVLWSLLDGKAYTATELAVMADTSPSNMSMHLNKLVEAELLSVESQGRHKYYRFARQEVAHAVEALAGLIPPAKRKKVATEDLTGIKYCRTCYDHLAGRVGVMITDGLLQQKIINQVDNIFELTSKGEKWFENLGIDLRELKSLRRPMARTCLDWSERRFHLAGSTGAALLEYMLHHDWMRRTKNSRVIVITGKGRQQLNKVLKVNV